MNFILSASSFIFPLITFPYVSRVLTTEGVGAVSFALSFVSYFSLVASLGIPTYGIRACAEVRDDKEELNKTAQELLIISIVTTFLVVAVYLTLIQVIPRLAQDKILFYICGLNIVLNTLGMNWFFQALEQYDYITVRSVVFKLVSLVLLFALVHQFDDYYLYAVLTVFAGVGSCMLNLIKICRMRVLKKTKKYSFKRHLKPTLILFAQSATSSIYTNLDTVMLGLMRTNAEVGYYYVATQIKQIFCMVILSFANVLLPRMTTYVKQKDKKSFYSTMVTGLNFSLFISVPVAVISCLLMSDAIYIFAGGGYEQSVIPTILLLFALIPIGLTQIIGVQVLTPLKREKQVLISVIIGAALNLILNFVLIPAVGVVGAAAATLAAEIAVLIVQCLFAKDLLTDAFKDIHLAKYACSALLSIFVASFVYLLCQDYLLIRLMLTVIIFLVVYGVVLVVMKDSLVLGVLRNAKHVFGNKI